MDVNINTEVKGYGVQAVAAVETEDKVKPQVNPVQEDSGAESGSLNERSLHNKLEEEASKPKLNKTPTPEELEKAVEEASKRLEAIGSNLSLGLAKDAETESIVAQIRDKSSNKIVRQFPPEEVLQLRAKLNDLMGTLFDHSV